jgi:hypothetical protein
MTDRQWFAFVYLPIGVCVVGALLAVIAVKLIDPAGRRATAIARKSSPDAMRTLIRLLSDPDGRIAAFAANSVLERAWGRVREASPRHGSSSRTSNS